MFFKESAIEHIFSKIDQNELVQLALTLADINSPTGREEDISNFVLNWFDKNGFYSKKQVVEEARFNAVGVLRGVGDGASLMFNGHLDTRLTDQTIEGSYVSNGRIYGNEIANMKGAIAAFMIAAKAIKEANIQLRGDLILATVIGEISTACVGPFQGPQDRGEGIGTRHLLANGVQSDYAVVADGSEFAIVRAQAGVAYFRIATKGTVLYSPFTKRPDNISESGNAIIKMTKVIDVIENWAREYERVNIYKFPGGQVEPKVNINAVQAGMPLLTEERWRTSFKPSQTPPSCDVYVDVRLAPGTSPIKIKHEIEELLSGLPFDWEIEMFRSQKGYEGTGPGVDCLCSVIEKTYKYVFESNPPPTSPSTCSMWTDTNLYWEIGIPAVKWGPTETVKYPDRRTAEIESLVRAAKVYSLTALEVCGQASK